MSPLTTGISRSGLIYSSQNKSAITNTGVQPSNISLLLHMDGANGSNLFIDSSLNALPITSTTNITTADSKFGGTSANFSSGTVRISSSYNTALDLMGSDFTVEAWIAPAAVSASGKRIASVCGSTIAFNGTDGIHWLLQLVPNGFNANLQFQLYTSTGVAGVTGSQIINMGYWAHVAVCVSGSTVYLAVNGVVESTTLSAAPLRPTSNPTLGIGLIPGEYAFGNTGFYGYMDEFRILKGLALYTSNYTVPTTAFSTPYLDEYFPNVSLLLHMNGSNGSTTFTDSSRNLITTTAYGDAQITTTQSKFNGSSGAFDGSGDYLIATHSSAFNLSNFSWTIEFFVRFATVSASYQNLIDFRTPTQTTNVPVIYANNADLIFDSGFGTSITASSVISSGVWYHIAVCKSGSSTKMFLNGTQIGSTLSDSNTYSNYSSLNIGRWPPGNASFFNGNMAELRIARNVARYTSNFTAPTEAFPTT